MPPTGLLISPHFPTRTAKKHLSRQFPWQTGVDIQKHIMDGWNEGRGIGMFYPEVIHMLFSWVLCRIYILTVRGGVAGGGSAD